MQEKAFPPLRGTGMKGRILENFVAKYRTFLDDSLEDIYMSSGLLIQSLRGGSGVERRHGLGETDGVLAASQELDRILAEKGNGQVRVISI